MSDYPPPQQEPGAAPEQPDPQGYPQPYQQYQPYQPYAGGPQYQYGGSQPPSGPPGAPPTQGPPPGTPTGPRSDDFQQRLVRRPEPRFTTAVAGLGIGMALFGVLVWGIAYWVEGLFDNPDTNRNLLGAILAAVFVIGGVGLAVTQRRGALATAGVVATGVGIPIAILFLTLDAQSSNGFNYDALFWVSFIAWGVCYAVVPGMRGHTFFVFLMGNQLIGYVVSKATDNVTASAVSGNSPDLPSNGTFAAIGLGFGLGYYAIAFLLDRSGRHGPATGLVYSAFIATAFGIGALSPDIHLLGAGILAVVIGLAICWYGGRYGRRLTCFAAAAGAAAGVVMIIFDQVGTDDGVDAGISFLIVGLVLVVIAALLARALNDPDDMAVGPVSGSR